MESSLTPAGCWDCGTRSAPRPLGKTPEGWSRTEHGGYLCPDCAWRLRLRPGQALRRILCAHAHQGAIIDKDVSVRWCEDCGHCEVRLAPLAPDAMLPDGRPAWDSAVSVPVVPFLVVAYGLVLCLLALVFGFMR